MQRLLRLLVPFILLGVAIVAFAFSIFILAYLFLIGALVGLILFLIAWIRERFFKSKQSVNQSKSGRIIDTDQWRKL